MGRNGVKGGEMGMLAAHNRLVGGSSPPGPTILNLCSFLFNHLVRKLANQTRKFASWCLRSVLHELLHRLLREALPVGGLCVALHLSKRGMAGDGGYLMRAASRLGKPPRCRFS